jgi:hypothetical protein
MFVARISGPIEMFSFVALIFGILFKLQSWPYASELFILGFIGLLLAYLILLPIRLIGLKAILPKADFNYAMATSLCLGILISSSALLVVLVLLGLGYQEVIYIVDIIRGIAAMGIVVAFIYDFSRKQPAPNTAQYAIAAWLRRRLNIIMLLIVISILSRFLL